MQFINTKKLQAVVIGLGVYIIPALAYAITPEEQARCNQLARQFGGMFDWALKDPGYCTLNGLLMKLINMGLAFAGVAAVIFIIIGGYRYLTAGGNDEQAEKGRKTLTNAIIGLAVIMLSFLMVRVATNFIVSGGSGSGSGTGGTPPATQGPPLSPERQAALADIVARALKEDAYIQNGEFTAVVRFDQSQRQNVMDACGVEPGSVSVRVEVDHKVIDEQPFTYDAANSQYIAKITAPESQVPNPQVVEYYMCGVRVNAIDFKN